MQKEWRIIPEKRWLSIAKHGHFVCNSMVFCFYYGHFVCNSMVFYFYYGHFCLQFEVRIVDAKAASRAKSWPNAGAGVEFVWSGRDDAAWAESRCQVESVVDSSSHAGSVEIQMAQPCLSCWATFKGQWPLHHTVTPPTAIEAIGTANCNSNANLETIFGIIVY